MSELVLLVARGRRWTSGCGGLVRLRRLYCFVRLVPRYEVDETCSKFTRPVQITTWIISRKLSWWDSLRKIFPRPQEYVNANVLLSGGRAVSTVPNQDSLDLSENGDEVIACNDERKTTGCKTRASIYLQQLLGFNPEAAKLCISDHRGFAIIDPADIPKNYQACLDAGFSEEAIRENPGILSHPLHVLKVKIQLITEMHMAAIDDAVPFFKLGVSLLQRITMSLKYEALDNEGMNKITYMAEHLQCSPFVVCQILAKHHFMRILSFTKLKEVLKIMLDFNVAREDILNDVWAFRYRSDIITERFKRATDAGVFPIKPWMIRCPEEALTKRIGKELSRRSVLGEKGTVVDYLSERLGCDKEQISLLVGKDPRIAHVSGPKVKRMADFLVENGYTVKHVMRVPRILFHRLETMQERLEELLKYGHKPESLIVFCKSKRQYDDYLKTVKWRWLMTDDH